MWAEYWTGDKGGGGRKKLTYPNNIHTYEERGKTVLVLFQKNRLNWYLSSGGGVKSTPW